MRIATEDAGRRRSRGAGAAGAVQLSTEAQSMMAAIAAQMAAEAAREEEERRRQEEAPGARATEGGPQIPGWQKPWPGVLGDFGGHLYKLLGCPQPRFLVRGCREGVGGYSRGTSTVEFRPHRQRPGGDAPRAEGKEGEGEG